MRHQVHPRARDVLDQFEFEGTYHFTTAEFQAKLGTSPVAARLALSRLARKGHVASPARGFYMIVPPSYWRLGCLPPDGFVPELMKYWGLEYYVALLSAAQYYGAAHHKPQVCQVAIGKNRRPTQCGGVRVWFYARKRISEVPARTFSTRYSMIRVSTPEATAIDLVGYVRRAGGFGNVVTVLSELAEELDPSRMVEAVATAPISWAQRLGYVLEAVNAPEKANPLREYIRSASSSAVRLRPGRPVSGATRSADWRLFVNAKVEPEA